MRPVSGQHRHRRIVAMQSLGGKDMRLDQQVERHQRSGTGADLIGRVGSGPCLHGHSDRAGG